MNPRITINGRFLTRRATGVERFAKELLQAWWSRGSGADSVRIVAPARKTPIDPQGLDIPLETLGALQGHAWEQLELPQHCRGDLLVNLCNSGPLSHEPQLAVLHDAGPVANPAAYGFAYRNWHRWMLHGLMRRARIVATVSHFSATELMHYFGRKARGIEIIYEGGEHILRTPSDPRIFARLGLDRQRYVLAVGSRSPNKNFAAVALAADMLKDLGIRVVAVGGHNPRVFARTDSRAEEGSLLMAGYASDGELRALYEHAQCFVFPSYYEGFGLPPLEAMHCGCPVVVSKRSALPEICGDAAAYCDPDDPSDVARQLRRVIESPALQAELREAGFGRAALFSWTRAASLFAELLNPSTCLAR